MANKTRKICLFCGKSEDSVERLIGGKFGYACGQCISEAYDVLNTVGNPITDKGTSGSICDRPG